MPTLITQLHNIIGPTALIYSLPPDLLTHPTWDYRNGLSKSIRSAITDRGISIQQIRNNRTFGPQSWQFTFLLYRTSRERIDLARYAQPVHRDQVGARPQGGPVAPRPLFH